MIISSGILRWFLTFYSTVTSNLLHAKTNFSFSQVVAVWLHTLGSGPVLIGVSQGDKAVLPSTVSSSADFHLSSSQAYL